MKVVVTGASGYLGGRLCHALLREGHYVRALVRSTSDLSALPPPSTPGADGASLEIVYGDVTDYPSLLSAFSSCHVIFHAAAVVEPWLPDPSKFFSVSTSPYYSWKNPILNFNFTYLIDRREHPRKWAENCER